MSKRYLITLKPIDKFFFGGDMTFAIPESKNDDKRKKDNRRFSSYIIKSMRFPQQTSLLGMLRFLLLRNDPECFDGTGIKATGTAKAETLIGPRSFCVSGSKGEFGQIERLSPCFIRDCKNERDFAFAPFDWDFYAEMTDDVGYVDGQKIMVPKLKVDAQKNPDYYEMSKDHEFMAKKGYSEYLLYKNGDDIKKIEVSDVFEEDRRIGIIKNYDGKTDDSGLFKQIGYRFKDFVEEKDTAKRIKVADYCFAFYATVKDECKLADYDGQIVLVGADSSQFVIHVADKCEDDRPTDVVGDCKVVLQSPSFISRETVKAASFFVSQTMPFRFMTTAVKNTKDYTLRAGYNRSRKYELYAPGSVFYFKDSEEAESFKEKLEQCEDFRQIGYNHYLNPKKSEI